MLLLLVLIPGIGHEVNGSRRWLRLAGFNLQVSEVARVFVLCWVADYAVRREKELRGTFSGLWKPLGLLCAFSGLHDGGAGLRGCHGAVRRGFRPAVPCRAQGCAGSLSAC